MTTTFLANEILNEELDLDELSDINGSMPVLIALGYAVTGFSIGAGGYTAYDWYKKNEEKIGKTKEKVADAAKDVADISNEDYKK